MAKIPNEDHLMRAMAAMDFMMWGLGLDMQESKSIFIRCSWTRDEDKHFVVCQFEVEKDPNAFKKLSSSKRFIDSVKRSNLVTLRAEHPAGRFTVVVSGSVL